MEYLPSFSDQLDVDYISHHGIKGMHWGVRRYQNPDGSLTPAGRKRYYREDGYLSQEGQEFNKKARTNFRNYRNATLYNTRAVNPDFVKAEKRYAELSKANSKQYKQDFDAFLQGKDFIGLDYEEFRDESYKRWQKSDLGKEEELVLKDLRRMLDDTAKEHPLYSKNYRQLRYFNSNVYSDMHNIPYSKALKDFDTMNYGKQVVNELMTAIQTDRVEDMWD